MLVLLVQQLAHGDLVLRLPLAVDHDLPAARRALHEEAAGLGTEVDAVRALRRG